MLCTSTRRAPSAWLRRPSTQFPAMVRDLSQDRSWRMRRAGGIGRANGIERLHREEQWMPSSPRMPRSELGTPHTPRRAETPRHTPRKPTSGTPHTPHTPLQRKGAFASPAQFATQTELTTDTRPPARRTWEAAVQEW